MSAAHDDAIGFRTTQREPGEPDLDQQGFRAQGAGGQHFDGLPGDKAEFAQASGDGVVGHMVFDAFDGGGDATREIGQPHGRRVQGKCELFSRIAPTARL